ncbi:hypothetical protein F5Y06DRAFT_297929 [Hypoxylon sp. FL0890]|nr:hypothetical protein F5Y06DRAFT_297929 [Hypoxylon sp. FL0890]
MEGPKSSGGTSATPLSNPESSTTSSAYSTPTITMSLVAVEVTSPDTIVVAREPKSAQPTEPGPTLMCEGPIINVRKGQKFDMTIEVERDEDDPEDPGALHAHHVEPTAEIDVAYEKSQAFSAEVRAISNSPVNMTLSAGKSYGLKASGGDIMDLTRVELSDVAIHNAGHYFLHLIIEEVETEDDEEVTEILVQIITTKIQVSE